MTIGFFLKKGGCGLIFHFVKIIWHMFYSKFSFSFQCYCVVWFAPWVGSYDTHGMNKGDDSLYNPSSFVLLKRHYADLILTQIEFISDI